MLLLYFLVAVVALLAIQSFMRDNYPAARGAFLWKLKLMDLNNALVVFVTLLGVVVALRQLEVSFQPIIIYTNGDYEDSDMGLKIEKGKAVWRCAVKNVGGGSAIVQKCTYALSFKSSSANTALGLKNSNGFVSYDEIVNLMSSAKLSEDRNYGLLHLTPGAAIGSQAEYTLFEFGAETDERLDTFDIHLEYTGMLGGNGHRDIHAIPPDGIDIELSRTDVPQK